MCLCISSNTSMLLFCYIFVAKWWLPILTLEQLPLYGCAPHSTADVEGKWQGAEEDREHHHSSHIAVKSSASEVSTPYQAGYVHLKQQ